MAQDMPQTVGAAYIRVSTEEQTELSPDSQLRLIQDYAAAHRIIVPPEFIFIDDGISGRGTKKRNAFNRMIGTAQAKPKPFDVILLWKFSRFARNREDSIVYKSMLRKQLGIEIISISEPIGDDKMSVLIEALIEAMDEYYSVNLSEEVKRGMTEKAMRGGLQAAPAYGYKVQDNVLTPYAPEACIVKEIFRRFLADGGYLPVARWCNDQGLKTHRGNPFENRTIEYMIRNPVYTGKLRWNPSGRSRRDFRHPDLIIRNALHEPIIDEATWVQAQELADELKTRWKSHARPAAEHKACISGLIRCADCGRAMVRSGTGAYQCSGYAKGRGCYSHWIPEERLMAAITARVRRDAENSTDISFRILQQQKPYDADALERRLRRLKGNQERLREAYLDGAESLEDYKAAKQKIEAEVSETSQMLNANAAAEDSSLRAEELQTALKRTLAVLDDPHATGRQKHDALHNCVDFCTWDKKNNHLCIRYFFYSR